MIWVLRDACLLGTMVTKAILAIIERLDRALASKYWVMHFQLAKVSHLLKETSDHSPILLSTVEQGFKEARPFRFRNVWSEDNSSIQVVEKAWRGTANKNRESLNTVKKLNITAMDLQRWNNMHFENVFKKIKKLEDTFLYQQSEVPPNIRK